MKKQNDEITILSKAKVNFDLEKIREDFPILHQQVNGKPLVYLDNGASSQKPKQVIDAIDNYYSNMHSNVHRGVHHLSQKATDAYEEVREKVKSFINAKESHEIIFTRGTTESINLLASSCGKSYIGSGDEVLLTEMEHHSNIVPWQMLCEEKGAVLKVAPINDAGEIIIEEFEKSLSKKTKIVAITHVSNTLGTINPIKSIISIAHQFGALVVIDGAQAVPHMAVDVQELDCDFYCFSAHKMYGPTGAGVLYGKEELLNELPPYHGGGNMIHQVTFEKTTYSDLPHKFEAGTPNIAGGIGLGAAIDYINNLTLDNIKAHEEKLTKYAITELEKIEELRFIGNAQNRTSVISFLIGDIHALDTGTILDQLGIAVRTGHHCTQPLMKKYGVAGTVRASFAFYNTFEEVDVLVNALRKAKEMLS